MEELVPGDIVNIEAGDLVPADGRILTAATLEIDESALTGESVPVPKQVDAVAADAALGDRIDLAFMNTQVTRGAGTLLVTSTGMTTEVGHISGMLQATKDEVTPLTRQLNALTNQILVIAGVALLISIGIGLWRDTPFDVLFLTAIAFAVSAIPTGLPGGRHRDPLGGHDDARRGRRHRQAPALGRDARLDLGDQLGQDRDADAQPDDRRPDGARRPALHDHRRGLLDRGPDHRGRRPARRSTSTGLLLPMALCADAEVRDGGLVGDPTEGALVVLAAKGGVDPTLARERYPRVATLPFDAAYKFMATFHRMEDADGQGRSSAPTSRAPRTSSWRAPRRPSARTARATRWTRSSAPYLAENERLGAQGLRVMATAQRDFDPATFDPNADLLPLVGDLELLALVGIVDPPRAEARDAIAKAHAAGIQVRMITGDHAVTAEAIARQLGHRGPGHHRRRVLGDVRRRGGRRRSTTSASSPGSRRRTRSGSSTSSAARATSWR